MNKLVTICAGGTGGHINAALSLGEYFQERDYQVRYFSGTRYLDYQLFDKVKAQTTHLDSKPLRAKNPVLIAKNLLLNLFVFMTVFAKYLGNRPMAVIGAGGYVCGPTLLAAKLLGIKTYIIEQNAVAGVTNKLLAKFSNRVFLNFKDTKGIPFGPRTMVAGNPVRSQITYQQTELNGPIRILVFGGSLGAKQVNDAIKNLVAKDWQKPISFVHQVGKGNLETYELGKNVAYEQKEYLDNMDELYRWANIIVARAGASTISELRVARRPSILVPFPFATDNHQEHNANQLKKENAFYVKVVDQDGSPEQIENEIHEGINEVVGKNLFAPFEEKKLENSCDIIFREVLKDVRN